MIKHKRLLLVSVLMMGMALITYVASEKLVPVQAQHHQKYTQSGVHWMEQSVVALGMARLSLGGCRAIIERKVDKDGMCEKTATTFNKLCDRTDVVIVKCEKALARLMKGDPNINIEYLDINITGCAAISVALESLAGEW